MLKCGSSGKLSAANYSEERKLLEAIVRVFIIPLVDIRYVLTRTSLAMILLTLMLIVSVLSFYTFIYKSRKYQV